MGKVYRAKSAQKRIVNASSLLNRWYYCMYSWNESLIDLLSLYIETVKCFYVVILEEQAMPLVAAAAAAAPVVAPVVAAFERAHSSSRD